ncbi:hypothetical protein TWF730_003742 [Orbilia blumenaviensis]|uniref:Capsid protein n=1 Tax=Orbilia blumenaviensis TaxID=1796055 RepID=A0AAV9U736_9PEZI
MDRNAPIIKSTEQPVAEQINPDTGLIDPVFRFGKHELYNANITLPEFVQPTYGNAQRCFETGNFEDIPIRVKESCISTNITYEEIPFLDYYPVCLLSKQFREDTLDGRFALSPQPIANLQVAWDQFSSPDGGSKSENGKPSSGPNLKPLPSGFEVQSRFWDDYGIFSTYLTANKSKTPVIQFNVDEYDGDVSKYTGSLEWFHSVSDNPYSTTWNVAAKAIRIAWRHSSNRYPLMHEELLQSRLVAKDVIQDRDSLLEKNTTYPNPGAVLDSASMWTRLHPWVVNRVYDQIPGVVKHNSTYYLPCDMPSYAIPQISFQFSQSRGSAESGGTWYPVKKRDFIIQTYRHPDIASLCAGTIQNAYRSPYLKWYPEMATEKKPPASIELGQWVFKSWYIVFKNMRDSTRKEGRRYVGIAKMA